MKCIKMNDLNVIRVSNGAAEYAVNADLAHYVSKSCYRGHLNQLKVRDSALRRRYFELRSARKVKKNMPKVIFDAGHGGKEKLSTYDKVMSKGVINSQPNIFMRILYFIFKPLIKIFRKDANGTQ